jgi:hypothetical protein
MPSPWDRAFKRGIAIQGMIAFPSLLLPWYGRRREGKAIIPWIAIPRLKARSHGEGMILTLQFHISYPDISSTNSTPQVRYFPWKAGYTILDGPNKELSLENINSLLGPSNIVYPAFHGKYRTCGVEFVEDMFHEKQDIRYWMDLTKNWYFLGSHPHHTHKLTYQLARWRYVRIWDMEEEEKEKRSFLE